MERGVVIVGAVRCTLREACKLIEHIDENNTVVLTTINKEKFIHGIPKKIKKKQGIKLVEEAKNIFFQDNDFFGVLSLYGTVKDEDVIYNILFPYNNLDNIIDYNTKNLSKRIFISK